MATATISKIVENSNTLMFEVNIGGALYNAIVLKTVFDALLTNLDKQNYVISILTLVRRTNRQFENTYPTLIGTTVIVPD